MRARRALRVTGVVQGVGFRPAVYRLAIDARLSGFVRNDAEGVWIEIEGEAEAVAAFPDRLHGGALPLARIDGIETTELAPQGDGEFRILDSVPGPATRAIVPADVATCEACLRELFDPADRRYRYPFINCTDCGPRYTIVRDVPYDRSRTTMDAFALCPACRAEYEDPASRRFHAEPNACPRCGPRLELVRAGEPPRRDDDALRGAIAALHEGSIVAVKSLGGFHLAVDAANDRAVRRLRERKRRPHKPFALMVRDLAGAAGVARLDPETIRALSSPARPIVLCPARPGSGVAPAVAPGLSELGLMLPYTPLHHLLLAESPPVLVMTSGNRSEEPIAKDDDEARAKLAGIADVFLLHDRGIHTRADDSVARMVGGAPQPVRRSRGFVPDAIPLGIASPPVLAVGAELKNTVCLVREGEAVLSPHVGDLEQLETSRFFEEVIEKLSRLLGVEPKIVAHDGHPDYVSTRWAIASGLPREPVQHHHAHVASCLAEHGRHGPAIGVAFDGTGCGPAGELWGGEILLADLGGFRRLGHLRPIALPGGEAAIREPWRLAVAALVDAGEPADAVPGVDTRRLATIVRMIHRGVSAPLATGAGRWFDAIAAMCGLRSTISYEGQAAVELEAAARAGEAELYPFELEPDEIFRIDLRPVVREVAREVRASAGVDGIAARFHETLSRAVAASCRLARERTGTGAVVLSGGCFQNRLLTERSRALLEGDGFEVLVHRRVPPNDGGVSLGQAAVAAWRRRCGDAGR